MTALRFASTDTLPMSLNFDTAVSETDPFLITQLKKDMRKSQLTKLQQKIGLLPTVFVSGSYNQHSMNNDVLAFADYEDSYTLSLGVSWSLWTPFTKGRSYAQVCNSLTLKEWALEENEAALNLNRDNLRREWTILPKLLLSITEKPLRQ